MPSEETTRPSENTTASSKETPTTSEETTKPSDETTKPKKYNIFISHRLEDRNIASAASGALRLLSKGRLEPFVCEDIPGGREWRDWIYKKIEKADMLLFLYTDVSQDWMWCFFEIGLFHDPKDTKARPIICLKDSSIKKLPSPLEKYQAYDATEDGITKFLEDLLYKGEFTNQDRVNKEVFANDSYALAIQDFLKAFKPSKIESQYFVRRAVFNIEENIDASKSEQRFDDITIGSDDSYTMEEILLSQGRLTRWQNLFDKFKAINQETWLEEIKATIENIEKDNALTYVMKPFWAKNDKRFLPFLTRVETKPSEADEGPAAITPIRIYVIFIPCADIEEKSDLIDIVKAADPRYLLGIWRTTLPTSIIRVKWKNKSGAMSYLPEDMDGEPVAYAINPTFANFYDFDYNDFPDPDGDKPVTVGYLLERVKNYVVDGEKRIQQIEKDQAEVGQKIIFEGKDAFAKVPFIFNAAHPYFPNSSYLPCLMSKSTVGDTNGPHINYLGVMYVRIDNSQNH
jgi:hypothetical protein